MIYFDKFFEVLKRHNESLTVTRWLVVGKACPPCEKEYREAYDLKFVEEDEETGDDDDVLRCYFCGKRFGLKQ
jgi:hypothetical protein